MNVGWLLDAGVFEDYHDELAAAIIRHGYLVKSVRRPRPPYSWDDVTPGYRGVFPKDACVIAHGDIDLIQRVKRDNRWQPGAFATIENFFCSRYFPQLEPWLLNRRYSILPFNELPNQSGRLFAEYGDNGHIFVRPDSPLKDFTGQLVSQAAMQQDLEYLAFHEFSKDSLVVVSSRQTILREWRLVIANGTIVAASQYKEGNTLIAIPGTVPGVHSFAQRVLGTGFSPDPVWVMDICETASHDYKIVEIGGFSFANLYACDKDDVVSAVSEVAISICKG